MTTSKRLDIVLLMLSRSYSMSASRLAKAAIVIPKRIERGPTDILKALASTIKHVPSEPDRLLQDDPYLLPIRPSDRNFYSLSKLSGISTAKFLLHKHPELFYRDDSEPKVRTFLPPEEFTAEMEFTEDDIKWCIENNDPVNAIVAYNALTKSDVKLSDETLLNFFELLCYSNEDKLYDLVEIQKSCFSKNSDRHLVNQTWNKTGLASKIFNEIKEDLDPPRVYSAMIAGLSKFNEHATAKQVFDDFKEFHANEGLYACAYDGLLASVPNLNSSVSTAHEAVDLIVRHMEEHLVRPNLRVFNSILTCYRRFVCDEETCRKAFNLLNDMRSLNIDPSLFTFINVINIICRSRQNYNKFGNIVPQLLDIVNSDDSILSIRDDRDPQYLPIGMRIFASQLNSLQLANKLHKVYLKNPNLFIHGGQKQGYLDNYFKLIVTTESMDNIWKFYTAYVPMNFRPSADSYDALAEALDLYQADPKIVKKVGEDIVNFRLNDRIQNDSIFRKDPEYLELVEQSLMTKEERISKQREKWNNTN